MVQRYSFKNLMDARLFHSAGEKIDLDRHMKQVAEIWGSLITLFGQTQYIEMDVEQAFTYYIEAIVNEEYSICFEIYYGSTGLTIRIDKEEKELELAKQMVEAFMDMLQDTKPTDFDYAGYYWEHGYKVELGVVDGNGYARYIELDE